MQGPPPLLAKDPNPLADRIIEDLQFATDFLFPPKWVTKKSPIHARNKWYNEELMQCKKQGRALERKWRLSETPEDLMRCKVHNCKYKSMILEAKHAFFQREIQGAQSNTKALFKLFNDFVSDPNKKDQTSNLAANDLQAFFEGKIVKAAEHIQELKNIWPVDIYPSAKDSPDVSKPSLLQFQELTEKELLAAIARIRNSTSPNDILPTEIMKKLAPFMVRDWSLVVNCSLATGLVPNAWKQAVVTPIIKKPGLNPEEVASYRPVSQLSFWARVIEAIVTAQFQRHLESTERLHDAQVGFRPQRGTEEAVLCVREWALGLRDRGHCPAVVLLDLTAAFDTVNHTTLVDRVECWGGVGEAPLRWMTSFLQGRSQQVLFQGQRADMAEVKQGVPQGSALSPALFNVYLRPLASLLEAEGLPFVMYADDLQLAVDCSDNTTRKITAPTVLRIIKNWLLDSDLLLNESKTEIIHCKQRGCTDAILEIWPLEWGTCPTPTGVARDLGVLVNTQFNNIEQVEHLVKGAHFHLWKISRVVRFLSIKERVTLIQGIVMSRLTYVLSALAGSPKKLIARVQALQNRALRLALGLKKRDHLTEARKQLKWLPIPSMIQAKLAGWAWKAVNNYGPKFVRQWLPPRPNTRQLRPLPIRQFSQTKINRKEAGGRQIQSLAPQIWASLPASIRSIKCWNRFKIELKNHLLSNV